MIGIVMDRHPRGRLLQQMALAQHVEQARRRILIGRADPQADAVAFLEDIRSRHEVDVEALGRGRGDRLRIGEIILER